MTENLYELLKKTAGEKGSRTLFHHDGRAQTYAEALAAVEALAGALKKRGLAKGDRFAIAMRNSPEFVSVYLALSKLGAVAVPINFLVSKTEELEYMLKDCGAVGVATQREFFKAYRQVLPRVPGVRLWLGADEAPDGGERIADLLSEGAPGSGPSEARGDDLACILYTSGTTGVPKGAMLTHSNLLSNAAAACQALELRESDLILDILPMFHTFAWMACVVAPIQLGARVLVVSSLTPPAPWLKLMGKMGVTVFAAVPQIYAVLGREAKGFKRLVLRYFSFRKVRFGVSGAAPLSEEVLRAFEDKLGVPILEGYGLTETSPVVSVNTLADRRPGTVGRAIAKVEVALLDDQEKPVAKGQEGEVCVRGPNVMKGYWNKPEGTKEAFTADGAWFKTGDIGLLDEDGFLKICDRKKDMIIIKGLKVFPAQVESVLLGHEAIAEAAVVGIPDDATHDETIKAFITVKDGANADKAEILRFLKDKLDPYKRPRDIEIVPSLPKNALQKVLKRELRRLELEKRAKNGSPR